MADTATARYGARQQSQGSNANTWGDDKLNEALRLLDMGSKGYQAYAMTGVAATDTFSWTNYVATNVGQCAVLKLTGSLSSAATLTVPSIQWVWNVVWNTCGQTVTMKTSAGVGVAIPNGRQVAVFCDGSDCYFAGANYIGLDIVETNSRDLMDMSAVATAIANANIPASAGTLLNSITDTTAGYLSSKITVTGSGAASVTASTLNPGANEERSFAISVGSLGLTDGGLVTASFSPAVGSKYRVPTGGTITLPAATGSNGVISLAIFGAGTSTLSGVVSAGGSILASLTVAGDQTIIITDADSTRGWV